MWWGLCLNPAAQIKIPFTFLKIYGSFDTSDNRDVFSLSPLFSTQTFPVKTSSQLAKLSSPSLKNHVSDHFPSHYSKANAILSLERMFYHFCFDDWWVFAHVLIACSILFTDKNEFSLWYHSVHVALLQFFQQNMTIVHLVQTTCTSCSLSVILLVVACLFFQ